MEMESEDESEMESDEDLLMLQLSDESVRARAHIPSELHGDAPNVPLPQAPPPPIKLDANGDPIPTEQLSEESESDSQATIELETGSHSEGESEGESESASESESEAESEVEEAPQKPWWATKAGRARNAMSESQRQRQSDPRHVLDHAIFHGAYSAPVNEDAEDTVPHGSAAKLMDSLAAIARNPLSDAVNGLASAPRSAADRQLAEAGLDSAMNEAGIDSDPESPRFMAPETNAGMEFDAGAAAVSRAPNPAAMRFASQLHSIDDEVNTKSESPAKFDANLHVTEGPAADAEAINHATVEGAEARFAEVKTDAGPPPDPKNAETGYGVGLRGMILSQDAAIIAGPNRYRSPTLVNPYSMAKAQAKNPYGPWDPNYVPAGAPYALYPYNYPYGYPGPTGPAPGPMPRGLRRGGVSSADKPTTIVNIYGGSGEVTTGATPKTIAAARSRSPAPFAAYPAPVTGGPMPLPYGDTYPPSSGPYPPPLSGLMDIAYSMQNRPGPGFPPTPLYGHPFQKVPVPQFPPSSPTVPYPRYPLGPVGALSESGWQKPRLIPIVYGNKV